MKTTTSLFVLGSLISPGFAALYTAGHGDIGIAYEDEGDGPEFFLHYHLGDDAIVDGVAVGNAPDGEEFDPVDITVVLGPGTEQTMSNIAVLNTGTGVSAGESIWILPQSETAGVPFMGIAAEELDSALFTGGATFSLVSVVSPSGSGQFSLWQPDGLGGFDFYFSTNSPGSTVDGGDLDVAEHDHFNFGFSEPGIWELELNVTAEHNTLGTLSDTETYTFQVIPEPSTVLLVALGGIGLFRRRR